MDILPIQKQWLQFTKDIIVEFEINEQMGNIE